MSRPPDREAPEPARDPSSEIGPEARDPSSPRGASFGAALGAAMLGLEQAIRREPPAQVLVHEHRPIRGLSGDGGTVTIEFPEEISSGPAEEGPAIEGAVDRA